MTPQHDPNPTNEGVTLYASLLPEFRACQNYADRLAFWQRHNLVSNLYYEAFDIEGPVLPFDYDRDPVVSWTKLDCAQLPIDFLNKRLKCKTWEDVQQLDILTLAPFTYEEAGQFVKWALKTRPGMANAPTPAEVSINAFTEKYQLIERKQKRFLKHHRKAANLWADDKAIIGRVRRQNLEGLLGDGIDMKLFTQFANALNSVEEIDLAKEVLIGRIEMDWVVIDTYLFAQSKYKYSLLLEGFDPKVHQRADFDKQTQVSQSRTIDKDKPLSRRQEVLLTILQNGQSYDRKLDSYRYNLWCKFVNASDRTGYANESWRKAKDLIEDYAAILGYLTPEQKERAEKEMLIIRAKR